MKDAKLLNEKREYLPIKLSFEGIGSESYKSGKDFIKVFLQQLKKFFFNKQGVAIN